MVVFRRLGFALGLSLAALALAGTQSADAGAGPFLGPVPTPDNEDYQD